MEDVLWIKPDTKGYKIASSGNKHSLILMDVGTEYTGAYTCIATNKAGQSICTAHLEVDDSKYPCLKIHCYCVHFLLLYFFLFEFEFDSIYACVTLSLAQQVKKETKATE